MTLIRLFLRQTNKSSFHIETDTKSSVKDVKHAISLQHNVDLNDIVLVYSHRILEDDMILQDLNIFDDTYMSCVLKSGSFVSSLGTSDTPTESKLEDEDEDIDMYDEEDSKLTDETKNQLIIQVFNGLTLRVELHKIDTVADLKYKLQELTGIPACRQQLLSEGQTLFNDTHVTTFQNEPDTLVYLIRKCIDEADLQVEYNKDTLRGYCPACDTIGAAFTPRALCAECNQESVVLTRAAKFHSIGIGTRSRFIQLARLHGSCSNATCGYVGMCKVGFLCTCLNNSASCPSRLGHHKWSEAEAPHCVGRYQCVYHADGVPGLVRAVQRLWSRLPAKRPTRASETVQKHAVSLV